MSIETNKALVRRFLEEAFNKRNLAVMDEIIAPNFGNHNSPGLNEIGPEGVRRMVAAQLEAFPDLHTEILELVAEADKVVVMAVDSFTSRADGKKKEITWMEIIKLADGKFIAARSVVDSTPAREEMKALTEHLSHH